MSKISELTFEHLLWQFTPVWAPPRIVFVRTILLLLLLLLLLAYGYIAIERELSKHSPATSGQFARRVAAWLLLGDALEMGIGGCTIAQRYLAAICRI